MKNRFTTMLTNCKQICKNFNGGGYLKSKKNKLFLLFIILLVIVGIFSITNITKKSYALTNYLYDQVKTDATTNGYGSTYTGEHADTVESDGTAIVGDKNIYYYNVAGHNNVKLGNFCWQIVRTTDTGGVKLLYNGSYLTDTKCNGNISRVLSSQMFNNLSNDAKYLGYKYNSSDLNDKSSTIKTYIDDWYSSNLSSLSSKLEDTVFCNDRSGSSSVTSASTGTTWRSTGKSTFYYHNYVSSYKKLSCLSEKDRFAVGNSEAKLTYPIGLLTAPEYNLTNNILYTTSAFWLMSPYNYTGGAYMTYISNAGQLKQLAVSSSGGLAVRPVVSLAPNIIYTSGTGSKSDPYIVGDVIRDNTITYSVTNGTLTGGSGSEIVVTNNNPTGREVTPEEGYIFKGWTCDKDVTLSDNTVISKGTIMTNAQVQSVKVNSDLTFTAYINGTFYNIIEEDIVNNSKGVEYEVGKNITYSSDSYTPDEATDKYDGTSGGKNVYYFTTPGYSNVKFGNFCWLVVRTTTTGGVKLLYNGIYSNDNKCNNTGTNSQFSKTSPFNYLYQSNAKYLGYKYKTNVDNDTDVYIKTIIDSWYETELIDYTKYLENAVFCNDRSGTWSGNGNYYTGTSWYAEGLPSGDDAFNYRNYRRNYKNLGCYNIKDRFSVDNDAAKLTYSIGLLSSPEFLLARVGGGLCSGEVYWLMSPYQMYNSNNYAQLAVTDPDGIDKCIERDYTWIKNAAYGAGVRPAISLKGNVNIISGDGTVNNPYNVDATRKIKAIIYYQSNGQVLTKEISCDTSGTSCSAAIPSEVRSSVGEYNTSYAGLASNYGTMNTVAGKTATTVTISDNTNLYSVYSTPVTNYYYSS